MSCPSILTTCLITLSGLEYQRQQLITERQQFHLEQLKAAEFRARQQAHHRLQQEQQQQGHPAGAVPAQPGQLPPTMGPGAQQAPQSQAVQSSGIIPPSAAGQPGHPVAPSGQQVMGQVQPPVSAGPPTTIGGQAPVTAPVGAPITGPVPPTAAASIPGPPPLAGAPVAATRP